MAWHGIAKPWRAVQSVPFSETCVSLAGSCYVSSPRWGRFSELVTGLLCLEIMIEDGIILRTECSAKLRPFPTEDYSFNFKHVCCADHGPFKG